MRTVLATVALALLPAFVVGQTIQSGGDYANRAPRTGQQTKPRYTKIYPHTGCTADTVYPNTKTDCRDISANLLHWWKFDDDLTDSGNGTALTFSATGSPTYVTGVNGKAVYDSAVAGDLTTGNQTAAIAIGDAATTRKFTVTLWYKQQTAGGANDYDLFYRLWLSGTVNIVQFYNQNNASNWQRLAITDTGNTQYVHCYTKPTIAENTTWHFFAFVIHGGGLGAGSVASMYRGDQGAPLQNAWGCATQTTNPSWNGNIAIPATMSHDVGHFGTLFYVDDLRFYDIALTPEEVNSIYQEQVIANGW